MRDRIGEKTTPSSSRKLSLRGLVHDLFDKELSSRTSDSERTPQLRSFRNSPFRDRAPSPITLPFRERRDLSRALSPVTPDLMQSEALSGILDSLGDPHAFGVSDVTEVLQSIVSLVEIYHHAGTRRKRVKTITEAEVECVASVKKLSEMMVWADQHSPELWKRFEDLKVSDKLVECLEIAKNPSIEMQILQCFAIWAHCIGKERQESQFLNSGLMNRIVSFEFEFQTEDTLFYFMSLLRSLSSNVDEENAPCFLRRMGEEADFPLYMKALRFFDHSDSLVRIAVRNITLTLFLNGGKEILSHVVRDSDKPDHYFARLSKRLSIISDAVVKVFVDANNKEPSLVKLVGLGDVLTELTNLLAYCNEILSISPTLLGPLLGGKLMEFYRPYIRRLTDLVRPARSKGRTAPATFAGLLPILALSIRIMDHKIIASAIASELGTFIGDIGYSPLYGIRALTTAARDERLVNLALMTMEACVASRRLSADNLSAAGYLLSEDALGRVLSRVGPVEISSSLVDPAEPLSDHGLELEEDNDSVQHLKDASKAQEAVPKVATSVSPTCKQVRMEVNDQFYVLPDMEDVLLSVFLRPSATRSGRVLQSAARLLIAVAEKTQDTQKCQSLARKFLDLSTDGLVRFLHLEEDNLNAARFEVLYSLFCQSIQSRIGLTESAPSLDDCLVSHNLAIQELRVTDNKRRRPIWSSDSLELECCQGDTDAFLVLFWLYITFVVQNSNSGSDERPNVHAQVKGFFRAIRAVLERRRDDDQVRKQSVVLKLLALVIEHDWTTTNGWYSTGESRGRMLSVRFGDTSPVGLVSTHLERLRRYPSSETVEVVREVEALLGNGEENG